MSLPAADSDVASKIESVTKQETIVPKDPYVESLLDEAVDLTVLPPFKPREASDQAAFSTDVGGIAAIEESSLNNIDMGGLLVVQDGDSLSQIALRIYGDATQYPRIFEENRDTLSDPNELRAGARLRIPTY